ncbi:B3 domain-containing transcription factor VRN1 [Ziziphus jujuba]|uniref:B3 domain-containing transcription factor VRN1 n=1 Tax=Ziziphus jujuba TaxID=326968 RepID=A0ABM3I9W0_ZIZJJ|nr:B3 domain-containing transcription factor VRN1 [Ziziphus jujuba]
MSKFYKILFQQERKLMLPPKFVQRYGRNLSDFAILKVPNGKKWKIKLQRRSNGEVWLHKGWADFSINYSMGHGTFLVFRYLGKPGVNSHFLVQIFSKKAMEIDYHQSNLPHSSDASSSEEEDDEEEESSESETSAQISDDDDDFPTSPKRGKAVQHQKKTRRETDQTRLRYAPNTKYSKSSTSQGHGQVFPNNQLDKKVEAIRAKEAFKCKHPLFVVGVQQGYIKAKYMYVPNTFIEEHLLHGFIDVTLETPNGKTWNVVLKPKPKARFCVGWPKFQSDNNLKVGDVIVFELVNKNPFAFKVRIN